MYGIELRESGAGVVVELWGEFDVFSLRDLREALSEVSDLRRPTLVDLSGVTFLDLQSARGLVARSLPDAHYLSFANPSAAALASIKALGLEGWIHLSPDRDEPPVFSEVFYRPAGREPPTAWCPPRRWGSVPDSTCPVLTLQTV